MKTKRVKGAKKIIKFYKNSFGIFEPYQVLIDLTFCQAALLGQVLLKEQIPKYFGADVKLVTTNCVIEEGKALGPALKGAVNIVKKIQVRVCEHKKTPVPAADCIKSLIGSTNAQRYFVATQDRKLQTHLETIPGIPVLYLNHNCMVLEKPTALSHEKAKEFQDSKVNPSALEKETIAKLKGNLESEQKVLRRKRKRPGGPNPLSVLKKKRIEADQTTSNPQKTKRPRKRKKTKIPAHVIQALTEDS